MDHIKEGEDPSCWTPDSLRKCQSLTLASDVALLKCMQNLSLRMVSSANGLLKDLDALNEDTTSACVEVEYCIQNLNLISTKQFMEKRVYDEEVTEKKEESTTQIQPVITSIDFVPKIKEAIREGLPAVKSQIANFEERINGNSSQSLNRNPNSHYSRSLPYLLGTEEFIDSPTVGVAEGRNFKSGSSSNLQLPIQTSHSTLSSVQSSPSLKSNLQVPVPVENRVHSDSDVSSMSEAGGGICSENKEIDETMKRPTLGNLKEELSARLKNAGDSKLKTTSEAYVTPNAKVPVKSESQRQELENSIHSHIVAAVQPMPVTVPSREIAKPPKKRNLFDDSSSESEGELFKTNLPKVPAVPPNLFSQPESKLPPTIPQLVVAKSNNTPTFVKTKSSTLFGSSDSEDDLFSGAITSNETTSKPVAKPIVKIAANFSDDEDNIFASQIAKPKNSQLPPTIKVAVPPIKSGSLFDDEDVPDFVAKKTILPVKVAAPVPKPQDQQPVLQTKQPQRSEQPQQRNLFADSEDSDDDLFRNIVVTKNKAPTLVVPPKTLSSSPLPDKLVTQSSRHQSTPIQNAEGKEEQEEQKRPASAKDNDNKPIHIEQHPKLKAKPSLLFDDDSDDEDLFAGVSVSAKPPPLATKVPALQDVQKDSKGKDLVTDVPPSKVTADVAEAIVGNPDDFFSGVLSTKPTSLSGTPFIARKPESSADGSAFGGVAQVTEKPTLPMKVAADPATIKMPSDKHVSASTPLLASSKTPIGLPVNIPDNQFGSQPTALQPPIPQQIPGLKAFEESDDEDLFGIQAKKRPPQPVPVKISAKTEEIQHAIKGEDLFVGIVEQKQPLPQPPVMSQKAPEKSETSSNERDSRQSPETEVKPQASAETVDKIAGRIASLKLSLAKQPNSLPFSNAAGSTATTPNDEDSTPISTSVVRKPFGGVPLFGPRIPSPVISNPPSPTKAEQKIMPGDSQNKDNEEVAQNSDLLDCVSKQRPKAPRNRKPPTRNFRRSQIQEDDDDDSMVTQPEETIQLPKETTPVVVSPVVTPPLPSPLKLDKKEASLVNESETKPANRSLFDDSDSSDGELFKTNASGTLSKAEAPLRKGGLKSNAKINSTLMGSGTDDSVLSSQSSIPTPKKVTTPSFLLADSDDDDDLFASAPKLHNRPKPDPTLVVSGNKAAAAAASDPLLHFQQ
ncbi:hypothetical protein DAPPUDRAFT_238755 [Daphnia pulex]|uniref:FAM21/CAPZIP domain-containing protein n=1 Tax=Daphnia pulex TaxID=6669 RepID=E9G7A8_DAPPU|nr:hypothetical protein DAPPUDRAFT_238755 [Daphnia pulex]|eukprot:EFX84681.1 hypothetical protein DAPPUDRAFT_238755 [Daphnia pulex]